MEKDKNGKIWIAGVIITVLLVLISLFGGYALSSLNRKDIDLADEQKNLKVEQGQIKGQIADLETWQMINTAKMNLLLKLGGVSDKRIEEIEKMYIFGKPPGR